VLYFLHYLIIGIFFVPEIPAIYQAAPAWLVSLELVILIGGVSAVALWLDRKYIVITL
jgi:hypothetical protein